MGRMWGKRREIPLLELKLCKIKYMAIAGLDRPWVPTGPCRWDTPEQCQLAEKDLEFGPL